MNIDNIKHVMYTSNCVIGLLLDIGGNANVETNAIKNKNIFKIIDNI